MALFKIFGKQIETVFSEIEANSKEEAIKIAENGVTWESVDCTFNIDIDEDNVEQIFEKKYCDFCSMEVDVDEHSNCSLCGAYIQ